MNQAPSGSLDRCSFSQVADAYLEMHREGKAPSIRELANSFPHLATEIREKLPAMKVLDGALGGDGDPAIDRSEPVAGCYIGEEIGRGLAASSIGPHSQTWIETLP